MTTPEEKFAALNALVNPSVKLRSTALDNMLGVLKDSEEDNRKLQKNYADALKEIDELKRTIFYILKASGGDIVIPSLILDSADSEHYTMNTEGDLRDRSVRIWLRHI